MIIIDPLTASLSINGCKRAMNLSNLFDFSPPSPPPRASSDGRALLQRSVPSVPPSEFQGHHCRGRRPRPRLRQNLLSQQRGFLLLPGQWSLPRPASQARLPSFMRALLATSEETAAGMVGSLTLYPPCLVSSLLLSDGPGNGQCTQSAVSLARPGSNSII